jgi:DNA-binding response OmpR family regulator
MNHTVLVVEDDPDNLDAITDLLTLEGYAVVPARSGKEARESSQDADFCLILVDYLLPDTTGTDLLRHLHGQDRHHGVPAVILTAAPPSSLSAAGAEVLTKPVALEDLLSVVRRHCDAREVAPRPV